MRRRRRKRRRTGKERRDFPASLPPDGQSSCDCSQERAMDSPVILLITATVLMLVHKGSNTNRRPSANVAPQVHLRERRCSCENLKDKECVYFCHIGIVWVDTPSQVIPYGLGSSQRRRKRHVERCVCGNPRDAPCLRFCSKVKQDVENGTIKMAHRKTFKERYKS